MNELVEKAIALVPQSGIAYESWIEALQGVTTNVNALVTHIRKIRALDFKVKVEGDGSIIHTVYPKAA